MYQSEIFDDFLYLLALKFFHMAGHTDATEVLFANHTPEQVVYFDSNIDISLSRVQREVLKSAINVSHIFDISDTTFEISRTGSVSFYSIELLGTKQNRTQVAYDIHSLLRIAFSGIGSVVLFRYNNELMLSVQGHNSNVYFSDWFHQDDDFELWAERINVSGISFKSSVDFINDFIYNSARCYLVYPITRETASYTMLPANYFSNFYFSDEDYKETACDYLIYAKKKYGNDFVEQGDMETLSVNVGAELDLLLFELELKNKNKDEEYLLSTASDNDEKLIEEYKFSSIDREIRQDPILMLKHIKQNIKK